MNLFPKILCDDIINLIYEYLDSSQLITDFKLPKDHCIFKRRSKKYFEYDSIKCNGSPSYTEYYWIMSQDLGERITKRDSMSIFNVTKKKMESIPEKYIKFHKNIYRHGYSLLYPTRLISILGFNRHKNLDGLMKYKNKLLKRAEDRRIKQEKNEKERLQLIETRKNDLIRELNRHNYKYEDNMGLCELYINSVDMSMKYFIELYETQRNEIQQKMQRKKNLIEKLKEKKLELRSDSYYCNSYINYDMYSIDIVIQKMCEAKFIHEYCNIKKAYDIFYNNKYKYYNNINNKNDIKRIVNKIALNSSGYSDFPKKWPWLDSL